MDVTMYQASVPPLARILDNLKAILGKAAAHAAARKIEPAALIDFRLYPDMFPLSRQVQIATDMAKGCAARLAGVEAPRYEDTETTFDQLVARLDKTVAYLKSFHPAQIDGSAEREIVFKIGRQERRFTGADYLLAFVLPNVHFHAATVYNILRHNGVELGKADFLGG